MNDMASSRKTGGLGWSGTLQSLSVPVAVHSAKPVRRALLQDHVLHARRTVASVQDIDP